MGSNILGVGQSALAAAQVGIVTTGHNIANATTPGYSRQVVTQSAAAPQNFGYGFVGQGTDVASIQRVYNQFISAQVSTSQTNKSEITSHLQQINQINTLMSDSDTGLSASFQDFFSGLQQMNARPADVAARQTGLSSLQTLVGRFQDISTQVANIGDNVNSQIKSTVDTVNAYAQQIAKLNDVIAAAENSTGQPPNDLLDQRDQLVLDLNKHVKANVVKQDGNKYSVFIGNGQPLVLGATVTKLTTTSLPSDPARIQVGYASGGTVIPLADSSLPGGSLGGLLKFRAQSLDPIKNQLGLIATNFAYTMNEQNKLGRDLDGALGADLLTMAKPVVTANADNTSGRFVEAAIVDARAMTASDYKVDYDGSAYKITRISDGAQNTYATLPSTMDGLRFQLQTTAPNAGDSYVIKPVLNGAAELKLAISDPAKFALASPVKTEAPSTNIGKAQISAGVVTQPYTAPLIGSPVTFTFDSAAPNSFMLTPPQSVFVGEGSAAVLYPSGTPVPYTPGKTISLVGFNFTITGAPADGDKFTVGPNTNARADNRNGLSLAALQNNGTLDGNNVTFQGAYSQLVNIVGNKTNELQVMGDAESKLLANAVNAQQSESGVNLDEEASNLLKYQQAYQAAGKLMQTASDMFDVLLNLR